MHEDLSRVAKALRLDLRHLERAAEDTKSELAKFTNLVEEYWSKNGHPAKEAINNADLVLFGSLAREEVTGESDCDYVVLQNGCPPDISQNLLEISGKVRSQMNYAAPGRQGVFGDIVIAANLFEKIGLESDSNQNLTHRLLLLTESRSIFSQNTYDSAIENILHRYCADYLPPRRDAGCVAKVPRHLVNDLIRFWRTMAVDFGAKRWRSKEDSNLRLIKLRTTRKILFAGPLCTMLLVPTRTTQATELQSYLRKWLAKPPLAQLASIVDDTALATKLRPASIDAVKSILLAYNELLGLFNERGVRDAIKDPKGAATVFASTIAQCNAIASRIQTNLEAIFFDDPVFSVNVRKYCLF